MILARFLKESRLVNEFRLLKGQPLWPCQNFAVSNLASTKQVLFMQAFHFSLRFVGPHRGGLGHKENLLIGPNDTGGNWATYDFFTKTHKTILIESTIFFLRSTKILTMQYQRRETTVLELCYTNE